MIAIIILHSRDGIDVIEIFPSESAAFSPKKGGKAFLTRGRQRGLAVALTTGFWPLG